MGGALHKGTHAAASRSGSEEMGAEDVPQSACGSAGAARMEEDNAALGLSRMGRVKSSLLVVRSQPTAAPLKLNFSVRRSGG